MPVIEKLIPPRVSQLQVWLGQVLIFQPSLFASLGQAFSMMAAGSLSLASYELGNDSGKC